MFAGREQKKRKKIKLPEWFSEGSLSWHSFKRVKCIKLFEKVFFLTFTYRWRNISTLFPFIVPSGTEAYMQFTFYEMFEIIFFFELLPFFIVEN